MLYGSNRLHNSMLTGILNTSMRFFESNPSGRILNRASKDQQVLDELLPVTLLDALQALLMTLGSIVIIGTINPWVLLILVPLVPAFLWLRRFYLRSSRPLKRLESVTRSPIYALFASSLDGLTTIRAFNVEDDFLHMFLERTDTNTRAHFTLNCAVRWFGLRLDLMTSVLALITAVLSVALRRQINSSAVALSLSYCINLTTLFQWAIRQSAEVENFMTSAERIHEYGQLIPEDAKYRGGANEPLIRPPNDWPARGVIEFKNYTFRYRPELDSVLKHITLHIRSEEKIGVIGRTGRINIWNYQLC
jgi:ATP-binding cassette, subfamily C (CFTR/MRP), member 4